MKFLSFVLFVFCIQVLTDDANADKNETSFARRCRFAFRFEWFKSDNGGMCLYWSEEQTDFDNAKKDCEAAGARLAVPNTPELLQILVTHNKKNNRIVWVGLDDIETDGTFVWHDGTVLEKKDYDQYFTIENPDNASRNQHCVTIWGHRQLLDDDFCVVLHHYVCEKIWDNV